MPAAGRRSSTGTHSFIPLLIILIVNLFHFICFFLFRFFIRLLLLQKCHKGVHHLAGVHPSQREEEGEREKRSH